MRCLPRQRNPKRDILAIESSKSPKFRNELIACARCNLELQRKHLAKHMQSAHLPTTVILKTKICKKSVGITTCSICEKQKSETWVFKDSSRGTISLCALCKNRCIEKSFGYLAMEKARLEKLRATLKELKVLHLEHPHDSFHQNLTNEIAAVEELIKRPPIPQRWSPVLPGGFGTGKRR